MTEDELSKAAMTEKSPDSALPYDWLAWYQLRDVYRDFKAGKITKEQGESAKASIFRGRQKEIDRNRMQQDAEQHLAKFWADIHAAANAYAKDPTIEHADKFFETVYGGVPRRNKEEIGHGS